MSKRPSFGSQFEKLKSLGAGRSLDERKPSAIAKPSGAVVEGGLTPLLSILGQSLSIANSVQSGQGESRTVSDVGCVQVEQSSEPNLMLTVLGDDTVQTGPCEKRTVSTMDTVSEGFTRVPHSLLRGDAKFSEPLDFMVYMHLYTYSYGFGRRDAHMSQAQLERFTGAAKNTIKRCLERLASQGWIKCIEEYECARMSRKWRVMTPEDRGGRPGSGRKRTGSPTDSVPSGSCPPQTGSLSGVAPLTVSKIDPYKESIPKEKTKNSLTHAIAPTVREYLASVRPFGKRESEQRAYQGLRQDYSDEQIASYVEHLLKHGLPVSSEPCHSPMGFLSKAMGQVWAEVQIQQEKRTRAEARERAEREAIERSFAEEAQAQSDSDLREQAFEQAFPSIEEQERVLERYADQFPMLGRHGPALRSLAIGAWWSGRRQGVVD